MTTTELATLLGISRQRVRAMIATGIIRARRRIIGTRAVWVVTPEEAARVASLDRPGGRPRRSAR